MRHEGAKRGRSTWLHRMGKIGKRLAWTWWVAAMALTVFLAGMYVNERGLFPSRLVRSAYKTLAINANFEGLQRLAGTDRAIVSPGRGAVKCAPVSRAARDDLRERFGFWTLSCPTEGVVRTNAAQARIEPVADEAVDDAAPLNGPTPMLDDPILIDPVLVKGEAGAFLDHCPAPWGCLAVEYSRSGVVSRAWPLRPEEIANANIVSESDFPYEHVLGWSFPRALRFFDLALYPNDDLLVVFNFKDSHPYGGGVARLAPDGRPRWYRKDYSHHWPHVVSEDLALVPSMRLRRERLSFGVGPRKKAMALECREGRIIEDQVNVIDGRGGVLEQIPILDAIIQSPYAASLHGAEDCDPTHLNFVDVLGADAGGTAGIAPGDLVVSLRNLNAFGILDKDDRRLKRLTWGSFRQQHGVRHLHEARFVMFDNLGTDGRHGPSRLLAIDLASGEESTLFPNDETPQHLRDWFALSAGQFDVSPDGQRALLTDARRAIEIRLADGRVLNVFRQLHDMSALPEFPDALAENAWLFRFHGIHYASRWR